MKNQEVIKSGSIVYSVEDNANTAPTLVSAEVSEVLPKQFRLILGDRLFNQNRISKHDPRVSLTPKRAINAYIARKKRQINDLNFKKNLRNNQLKLAKSLLEEIK